MPRGVPLSDLEKGQILAFHHECWSIKGITEHLSRCRTVVRNFLSNPQRYDAKKSRGKCIKLTAAHKRRLVRKAALTPSTAKNLKQSLNLPVSISTVRRALRSTKRLKFMKMRTAPKLSARHKLNRIIWCEHKLGWGTRGWENVIFSDEKKFNLDGPDGFAYYRYDLSQEKRVFSKCENGGGSLMIWAAFSFEGKSELCFLEGNQNGSKFIDMLQDYLLPFAAEKHGQDFIFQYDGAPTNRSYMVKQWLLDKNVTTLDWPAYSPDLNPIENLWAILARGVYKNARQFDDVDELYDAVVEKWDRIQHSVLEKLIHSMPKRMGEVLKRREATTKY